MASSRQPLDDKKTFRYSRTKRQNFNYKFADFKIIQFISSSTNS